MKILVKSCISYVMSKRWSVIVKIVRGRRKRNKLETFFRAFLSNYSTLSLIPNPIFWYYIPRSITGTSKNNKIPALSNKLMEALRRGKQQSEQVRETNRAEVDGKRERRREGVVGRELINDVERKRSGWTFLFTGSMISEESSGRVWKDQSWSGSNSRPSPLLPDPDDFSIRGKIRKTNLFSWKIFFNVSTSLFLFSSLLYLFSSSSFSSSLSFPYRISRFVETKKEREIETRERERRGGEITRERSTLLPAATRSGRAIALPAPSPSPPPPLASLNYARSFISGGTSAPDIFQVRWVRRRPGKTVFVARRWTCLLLEGKKFGRKIWKTRCHGIIGGGKNGRRWKVSVSWILCMLRKIFMLYNGIYIPI